jgi:integrase
MRGHIRKRGNTFEIVVFLGLENGRRRYQYEYRPTRREAEARLAQLMVQMQADGSVIPSRLTTGDFLDQWLRDDIEHRVGPKTEATYRYAVTHYLAPLSEIRLQRLSTPAIQRCLNALLERDVIVPKRRHKISRPTLESDAITLKGRRKVSAATVHQAYRVLNTALNTAVAWKLLTRNPCDHVKPPTVDQRPATVWDEEQVRLFLAEAKRSSRYYLLYLTILLTGMRPSEALGLRWAVINLLAQEMLIREKFLRLYGKERMNRPREVWGATKTHQQTPLAIPDRLLEELRRHRDEQDREKTAFGEKYEDNDLVFCQPNGKPLHERNINRRDFRRVSKRAGVPRIRFYDLRHNCGSHLADQGEPMPVVQRQLGHKNARTTTRYYIHVVRDARQAVARLEDRFLGHSKKLG